MRERTDLRKRRYDQASPEGLLSGRWEPESPQRGQSLVEFALAVPILLTLLVGIGDLARLYTAMMTIESAAREAADYGAFSSSNWLEVDPDGPGPLVSNRDRTLAAMEERACVASGNLTDYSGTSTTCTNPLIAVTLLGG